MKSIIKRILNEDYGVSYFNSLKNSKLKRYVDNYLDSEDDNSDVEITIDELKTKLALDYPTISFLVFLYFVENGEDPLDYMNLEYWVYKF